MPSLQLPCAVFFLEILSSRINLSNSSSSSTSIYKKSFGGKVSALFLLLDDHFGINCSCFLDAASWCAWKKNSCSSGGGPQWFQKAKTRRKYIHFSLCIMWFHEFVIPKFSISVFGKEKCLTFKSFELNLSNYCCQIF